MSMQQVCNEPVDIDYGRLGHLLEMKPTKNNAMRKQNGMKKGTYNPNIDYRQLNA